MGNPNAIYLPYLDLSDYRLYIVRYNISWPIRNLKDLKRSMVTLPILFGQNQHIFLERNSQIVRETV